jgi:transketolase
MIKLTKGQKDIRRRIVEISYALNFSHLGSCLSAVDIIEAIYKIKKKNERFVLSNGHAGVALYAVLQKYCFVSTSAIRKMHVHPDRNSRFHIDVSTGSLGQGLPIALGMALANRKKNVYCLLSDGECAEGSIWESLQVGIEQRMNNLKIVINANGWAAYSSVSASLLIKSIRGFGYKVIKTDGHSPAKLMEALKIKTSRQPLLIMAKTTVEQFPFLKGQDAHYYVMKKNDYDSAINILK